MAAAKGKKLINSVDRCVDDNLEGYVALNPGARLLKGHRIVIRADFQVLEKTDKVAVVCGGGSGHEPAFAGIKISSSSWFTITSLPTCHFASNRNNTLLSCGSVTTIWLN